MDVQLLYRGRIGQDDRFGWAPNLMFPQTRVVINIAVQHLATKRISTRLRQIEFVPPCSIAQHRVELDCPLGLGQQRFDEVFLHLALTIDRPPIMETDRQTPNLNCFA